MTLEISLQPSLAAYVSEQAAAAHTSPARYVQRLIKQQQEREKTLMRAMVGNYLELIKKDADKKGWIPMDKVLPPRKRKKLAEESGEEIKG